MLHSPPASAPQVTRAPWTTVHKQCFGASQPLRYGRCFFTVRASRSFLVVGETHKRLHPLGSSSVWSSDCTAKRLLLSCTWAALSLQPLSWGGQSITLLVPPLDSCRVLLCSSLRVSGLLRHSKATRRCEGQQW